MQSERVAIGQGPAHPCRHQRKGREVGNDLHFAKGNEFKQFAGNAVVRWVAGGEDHRLAPAQGFHLFNHGRKGLGPFEVFGPELWQEAKKAA